MIRADMEDTRTALTEKLEVLENQVMGTVQEARSAVSQTVETLKDTVGTVKETVTDTVSAVKESVQEGVATVKDWLDVRAQVDRHPWIMTGGSILAGYLIGTMFDRWTEGEATGLPPPSEGGASETHRLGNGRRHGGMRTKRHHDEGQSWLAGFAPELNKLKGLALGTLLGTAREMVTRSVPPELGQKLGEVVDNITAKLGGEQLPSSTWDGLSQYKAGEHHEGSNETKMGGAMGTAHGQGQAPLGRFDR
jgi:hypothetical protein